MHVAARLAHHQFVEVVLHDAARPRVLQGREGPFGGERYRFGEIEAERAVLEQRSRIYEPAEIARAGVFVSIDAEGGLHIDRGYVRPEDEVPDAGSDQGDEPSVGDDEAAEHAVQRAVITIGGQLQAVRSAGIVDSRLAVASAVYS